MQTKNITHKWDSAAPWLLLAAAVMVIQALIALSTSPGITGMAAIVVAIALATLLLRGSRVAWSITLIDSVVRVVTAVAPADTWLLAAGIVVVGCVLAPSSVRFVWRQKTPGDLSQSNTLGRAYPWGEGLSHRMLSYAAAWEANDLSGDRPGGDRSYGALVRRLGLTTVILLVLVGATYSWQQGSGQNSALVNLIADVTWTCWALVQLAFLAVLLLASHNYFKSRRGEVRAPSRSTDDR